ncbi:ABC-2 transporter permease [Glycomyces tarimensis]
MNLFQAELHRIARRRMTLIFGICTFAGLLLLTGVMWFNSSTGPSDAELAQAQKEAGRYDECIADEDYFENHPEFPWVAEDPYYQDLSHEQLCAEFFVADAEPEEYLYFYTFKFHDEGVLLLVGVGIVTGLLTMLLAASAVGAEWSSGGMANLLVWHPNRMKVWAAKLAAALTVCVAGLLTVLVLGFGLLYLTASVRGEVGTLNGAWWGDTFETLGRTGVLALGMTLLGSALAMLGRHTAIAGGVIAGYLIIGDLLVQMTGFALDVKFPDRFSLYTWVAAWIDGRITLYDWSGAVEEQMTITATDAGLLLGGIVLVFTVLATLSFAKRDVT